MGRRTAAEAARFAVERLLKQRKAAMERLQSIDAEIAEVADALGIPLGSIALPESAAQPRPAMAGARDPGAKPRAMEELIAEARKKPMAQTSQERAPFVELTQGEVLGNEPGNVSPADNQGTGRWV